MSLKLCRVKIPLVGLTEREKKLGALEQGGQREARGIIMKSASELQPTLITLPPDTHLVDRM